jgi:hypothetical protein
MEESDLDILIEVLEASVEKNGEKPLTNKWLLNIAKIAQSKRDSDDELEGLGYYDLIQD